MRHSILFAALMGLGALAAGAAPDSAWQHAASQYVNAARGEDNAYQRQIDSAPADRSPRYQAARADLRKCDQLVGEMGSADPQHFDGLKAQYERTRSRLASDLRQAQQR